jgi:superoxide dismutase
MTRRTQKHSAHRALFRSRVHLMGDFGSVMAWHAEFTTMAKALSGGSGWAILAWGRPTDIPVSAPSREFLAHLILVADSMCRAASQAS